MKNNSKIILSTIAAIAILTGCGGSGGGTDTKKVEISNHEISGKVIDPAIIGATVKIKCNDITYNASNKTDQNGSFVISTVPGDINLSTCTLISTGGNDGDDFTGLTLKSPYKLYQNETGIYITPFTTLLAEHDDLNTNLDSAKDDVAKFLGISNVNDLLIDPTSKLALAKISKQISKVALLKTKEGELLGFVDIDANNVTQDSLDKYIQNDLTNVEDDIKLELQEIIDSINNAEDINDIQKQAIIGNVFYQLKNAYKLSSYTDIQENNLKILAEKITQANKKEEKYQAVTKFHIRKALTDVDLVPSFSDEEQTILSDDILSTLNLSAENFESYLIQDNKVIDIASIEGLTLFDSNTYEQVLGNDNEKRRNYYTYSDKSNISKALSLTSNNYNDQVNDSINRMVSLGLAKHGFYEEGFKYIDDNIYTYDELKKSYINLAKELQKLNQYDLSTQAWMKYYHKIKVTIETLGETNAFANGSPTELVDIITALNEMNKTTQSKEVMDYYIEFSNKAVEGAAAQYSVPGQVYYEFIRILSEMSYTQYSKGNLVKAKEYAKKAAKASINIPSGIYNGFGFPLDVNNFPVEAGYSSAITAAFFGEDEASQIAGNRADTLPEFLEYGDPTDTYGLRIVYKGLSGRLTESLSDFDSSSLQMQALDYGYAAVLYSKGKEDKLFEIYNNKNIYSLEDQYKIAEHINLRVNSFWEINNTTGIKLLAGEEKLKSYLDKMYILMQTWDISLDENAQKVYADYIDDERVHKESKTTGYLAMAKLYKELGEIEKAKIVLSSSFDKINALSNTFYKTQGLINILKMRKELKLYNEAEDKFILSRLESVAMMESFDDSSIIIDAANFFSKLNEKEIALKLLNKAYLLIPKLINGDLTNIEKIVKALSSSDGLLKSMKNSIAYAYYQAGNLNKAKDLITEAYKAIQTLEDTTNKYKLLIPITSSYGFLNDGDAAKKIFPQIKTKQEKEKSLEYTAQGLAEYDAFIHTPVASVDSDADGSPDFFNIGVSSEEIANSGLTLDEDIDNDGINDSVDSLPYDKVE